MMGISAGKGGPREGPYVRRWMGYLRAADEGQPTQPHVAAVHSDRGVNLVEGEDRSYFSRVPVSYDDLASPGGQDSVEDILLAIVTCSKKGQQQDWMEQWFLSLRYPFSCWRIWAKTPS